MVQAGEASGTLDVVLDRLALQTEKDAQIKRRVKSAMVYPSVVLGFATIVLSGMLIFLVPIFAGIFKRRAFRQGKRQLQLAQSVARARNVYVFGRVRGNNDKKSICGPRFKYFTERVQITRARCNLHRHSQRITHVIPQRPQRAAIDIPYLEKWTDCQIAAGFPQFQKSLQGAPQIQAGNRTPGFPLRV